MKKLEKFREVLEVIEKKEIKLLSLDIFDTLIFRIVRSPSDVFLEMGQILKSKYDYKFKMTPFEFRQIRIQAEQKARGNKKEEFGTDEVFLSEIYKCMPELCCSSKGLGDLELELEKKYCYLNPQIYELINICKLNEIKVVLASDMYLNLGQIKSILKFNGLNLGSIDKFFISSEKNVSKSSEGKLFKEIIKEYSTLKPHEMLHIGDSLFSDIINAEKFNIRTFHYNLLSDEKGTLFELEKMKYNNIVPEILSLRKLAHSEGSNFDDNARIWYEVGAAVLGPFLTLFCEWVVDTAVKENVKEIYPLMREGYILEKMLKKIVKYRNLEINIKPIYISRKAIFLPSLKFLDNEVLKKMFERSNFTVEDLFNSLKIDQYIERFSEFKNVKLEDAYKINVNNGNLKNEIFEYMLSDKIKNIIDYNINQQRNLFIQYFEQDFNIDHRFITVDLGFRGTMQSALDNILDSYKNDRIIHLLAFGEECIKNNLLLGQDIRGFIGNAGENIDIVKSITWCPDIIEELMMGNVGSTLGYQESDGKFMPVLDKNRIPRKELELKDICMRGILKFQRMFLDFIEIKPFIKEKIFENKRSMGNMLERLYKIPTFKEAVALSKLHHESNYGSKNIIRINDNCNNDVLDKIDIEKFLKLANPKDFKWPQALVTIKHPNYILKKLIEDSDKEGYLKSMCSIAENVSNNGILEIMIYGSGEAGNYLMRALELYDIRVTYMIDRNESLHGKYINNVEVISLKEAIRKGNHTYAIGSFAFKNEIKQDILERYIYLNIKPKIFLLQDLI
ncbi:MULTISPECIES: haloacid dehalogenase [unclassified Clostridium]|uniref:haloacid dehalogenase n=1 Tax=unclassified Clostridium TaxID=2614128 RepID=UPI00029724C7|nr:MULTISPECIES: haloacid dehalogenase [unclassified Clostridium]EKQ51105.1 MAG: putative hydrolase (HAD superfamily) [Clostridium sp. Maddingley MBC34-26]